MACAVQTTTHGHGAQKGGDGGSVRVLGQTQAVLDKGLRDGVRVQRLLAAKQLWGLVRAGEPASKKGRVIGKKKLRQEGKEAKRAET